MFKSLKQLVESRLGRRIVLSDLTVGEVYFIKILPKELLRTTNFLLHDPDTNLSLFHNMILIPTGVIPWPNLDQINLNKFEIIYQFKSLRLPYEASVVLDIPSGDEQIPSLGELFFGAKFFEKDIGLKLGIEFESSERDYLSKRGITLW